MITDKIIGDILCGCLLIKANGSALTIPDIKQSLKEKGYEVEGPKSKLDEAVEFALLILDCGPKGLCYNKSQVDNKISLYESAVKELQKELDYINSVLNQTELSLKKYKYENDDIYKCLDRKEKEIKDIKQRLVAVEKSRLKLIEDHKKEIANMKRCTNCGIKYGYANPICIECENHSNWTKYV